MIKKVLFFVVLSVGMISLAFGQNKLITGKVTSTTNQALPGVSVAVKGAGKISTQTDANGTYKLTIPQDTKTIVFTSIGFIAKEVDANSATINVTLEEDKMDLSEVVVVGYGTQIKRDLTGSIAQVKSKDLENLPVTSFEGALQGKAAGVNIVSQNGKLGQGITVRVRGAASVSAGSEPLYIVDGIPITSGSYSSTSAPTNALADLNTNDIESIEVLKDAASSAIYGARASNGVVLITTKQGKIGKATIGFNVLAGVNSPTNQREFLNAEQFVQMARRAGAGAGSFEFRNGEWDTLAEGLAYYAPRIETRLNRYSAGNDDYKTFKVNTNWEDGAYSKSPLTQQYDLNISGGTEKSKYYIAGQVMDQKGILMNNRYKRYSGRLNTTNKINDFIELGVNLNFSSSVNDRLSNDNAFSTPLQAVALAPITPLIDPRTGLTTGYPFGTAPNFLYQNTTTYYNPQLSYDNSFYKAIVYRTIGKAFANINIAKGLKFTTDFSIDNLNQNEEGYYGFATGQNTGSYNGSGLNYGTFVINTNTNNFFSYNTTFGEKSNFDAVLGTSYQKVTNRFNSIDAQDFPSDSYKKLGSAATKNSASSSESAFSFLSYFLKANYKYNNKYILGFSTRIDGSSRFGANNKYGVFPAGSLAWIVSEENFLNTTNVFNLLKLRVTYGLTGNAEIGNFAALGLYSGSGAYGGLPGQLPSQIANPDLSWEKTTQFDVGLDFAILKNRVSGTMDYYIKNTTDLLLAAPIPQSSGFSSITRNLGALDNRGFEFGLNTENFTGDFKWSTGLTFSYNQNKIKNLGGQVLNANQINAAIEGQPIGVFYLPEFAGVDPANGDAIYYLNTKKADGSIDRTITNDINSAERIFAGNPNPNFIYGLNNTFSFKNFDLNVFFQGVQGNKIFNGGGQYMSASFSNGYDNQTIDQLAYWDKPGDITNVPEPRLFYGNGVGNSTRYLSDGSFVRLKTLTLGYNLPREALNKLKLNRLRVFATGLNLLTFTKYKGWDPEVNSDYQSTNINQGVDFYSAPQARVISFGINIGL